MMLSTGSLGEYEKNTKIEIKDREKYICSSNRTMLTWLWRLRGIKSRGSEIESEREREKGVVSE